jgi:hypothetical protein
VKTNFETLVNLVICAEKESKPRHELVLNIGLTPQRLVGLGFDALTLVVKAKTIGKMFFEHGLTQGQIEKIPAMLEAPREIYRSDTHPTNMTLRDDGRIRDCCCGKKWAAAAMKGALPDTTFWL